MAGKASPRKLIFFVILSMLLIAGFSLSTYYYILGRYTDQVVDIVESVMSDFSSEELESLINDEELLLALNEWQESKSDLDDILGEMGDIDIQGINSDAADDGNDASDNPHSEGSEITIQDTYNSASANSNSNGGSGGSSNSVNDSSNSAGSESDGGSGGTDNSSSESQQDDHDDKNAVPAEDDDNSSSTPEVPQEVDQSLANKLSAQDTVFMLQVYRKFSADERDELKELYYEGGNREVIKEKVTEKLTPEEIEKSIEIALRILG